VRATLVTAATSAAWTPGVSALRQAAWAGRLDVLPVAPASPASPDSGAASDVARSALVVGPDGGGRYVAAALGALGWTVARRDVADGAEGDPSLVLSLAPPTADGREALRDRAEAGATVVLPGRIEMEGREIRDGGDVVFPGGLRAAGVSGRQDVEAAPGARVAAAWDDGQPAVLAERVGRGCVVSAGFALEGGALPMTGAYPRVIERLATACAGEGDAGAPLDRGALAVLRGGGPAALPSRVLSGADAGLRLERWALGLLLAVALVETAFAYGRRERA
jgi:hypothetical protein